MVNWKTIAIIFIILFVLETSFFVLVVKIGMDEERETYECLYNICSESYDADYINGVCTCYDLDTLGSYVISKTGYMK